MENDFVTEDVFSNAIKLAEDIAQETCVYATCCGCYVKDKQCFKNLHKVLWQGIVDLLQHADIVYDKNDSDLIICPIDLKKLVFTRLSLPYVNEFYCYACEYTADESCAKCFVYDNEKGACGNVGSTYSLLKKAVLAKNFPLAVTYAEKIRDCE